MIKIFCVISHTHWDREWYLPFEKFRIKLVDMFDNLLDVLEEYQEYIFHLDAQTIVLEDYLEIKPYKKDILEKHIKEGRLLIGPWYVQNDFYLTSGESTIRNLLIGSGLAEKMGKCSLVGYTPDQFGLISQLPQIFNGFGIDNCIFGRGYAFYDSKDGELLHCPRPSELIWQSEDGSKVLAVHMPFWYNNAQRFSEDIDKSIKLIEMNERNYEGIALTPYILMMNGVDHLEAQENLIPILQKLKDRLPEGKYVRQLTMQQYIDNVKQYMEKEQCSEVIREKFMTYNGEMRNGMDYNVLQGTLSSRIYLKVMNVKAQNLLECRLEPIYSFIYMLSGGMYKYPSDFMSYLWKLLVQNHPHDSICGCSKDQVHRHMEDRYERIFEAGDELLARGMEFITSHITRDKLSEEEYLITVFNTVESSREGVVEIDIQLPADENVQGFDIMDKNGRSIPFGIIEKSQRSKDIFSPINLPGEKTVDSHRIQIYVDNIEGLSYRTFVVKPSKAVMEASLFKGNESGSMEMENDYIKVIISEDGKISLINKETGKVYNDILKLEDTEDCGDSYVYKKAAESRTFSTDGTTPEIKCLLKTLLETRYSLVYELLLPEFFDAASGKRSEGVVCNTIEIILGLKKGCPWLELSIKINNRSEDHRLRALVSTGIDTDYTYSSIPFDVIKRDRRDALKGIKDGTQPNSGLKMKLGV